MQKIDRQADRIIAQHLAGLGSNESPMQSAEIPAPDDQSFKNNDLTNRNPATENPPPTNLPFSYTATDPEKWDIDEILQQYDSVPDDAPRLNLSQVLEYTVGHAPEYITAKEELLLAALKLLTQRHNFGPRFFNDVTASIDADVEDGDWYAASQIVNSFRITDQIESGGEIGIQALIQATEQLRSSVSTDSTQNAQIILSANLPLLRGAGTVASESLISAERQMVYATRTFERFRRQFLFDIATDYYNLVLTAKQIRISEKALENRKELLAETKALYEAGRKPQSEYSETEQRVLSSQNSMAAQHDRYILQLERFRIRLGYPPNALILINEDTLFDETVPVLDLSESAQRALQYRLDLQNQKDQLDDSLRAIKNARNELLPELNLSASMTMITNPDLQHGGLNFDPDETDMSASLTYGLPLDRENERIGLKQATVSYQRALRNFNQTKDNIILSVRSAIRDIQLAQLSVRLQNENVKNVKHRLEGLEVRKDKVSSRAFIDAQDELDTAENALESAKRDVQVAFLRFLLESGQFRVETNGRIRLPINVEKTE